MQTNDVHSGLNPTCVSREVAAQTLGDVVRTVRRARTEGTAIAISGGRHAMGGQQFLSGGTLLDMLGMNRVRRFDQERGLLEVEAGIQWPNLLRAYLAGPAGKFCPWGIRQKQTGADRLTVGGSVSANIHGRCLNAPPFVDDLESLEVVTADGEVVRCSRSERRDLFRHVIGGYGLFGVITAATLRLTRRQQVERLVELCEIDAVMDRLNARIAGGALYGDFQFAIDHKNQNFLRTGVLSCYVPTGDVRPIPPRQRRLSQAEWNHLIDWAHSDKTRAFHEFTNFYLATSGQRYWSDTHQLNLYLENYHTALDERRGCGVRGGEMITELYVPRDRLTMLMDAIRRDFLKNPTNLIYGTIRLIDRDSESALPWAKDRYACVIFNLHVDHRPDEVEKARTAFVRLIDQAIEQGGNYYLTYHRWAEPRQLQECYPELPAWLRYKRSVDPDAVFASDWFSYLLRAANGGST